MTSSVQRFSDLFGPLSRDRPTRWLKSNIWLKDRGEIDVQLGEGYGLTRCPSTALIWPTSQQSEYPYTRRVRGQTIVRRACVSTTFPWGRPKTLYNASNLRGVAWIRRGLGISRTGQSLTFSLLFDFFACLWWELKLGFHHKDLFSCLFL